MAAVDNYLYLYWSNFKKDSKPDFNIIENMKEKILIRAQEAIFTYYKKTMSNNDLERILGLLK